MVGASFSFETPVELMKRLSFLVFILLSSISLSRGQSDSTRSPGTATRPRTVTKPSPERQSLPPAQAVVPPPAESRAITVAGPASGPPKSAASPVSPVLSAWDPGTSSSPTLPEDAQAQPLSHPLSPARIHQRITEALRLLKSRPVLTAMTATVPVPTTASASTSTTLAAPATPKVLSASATGTSPARPIGPAIVAPTQPVTILRPIDFVTLAVLDKESSKIHLLTLTKQTFLTKGAEMPVMSSLGTLMHLHVLRVNGVNTAVNVFDDAGRALIPLVVEYPIERHGTLREMAYYTSAHPTLLSEDLVRAGQSYVHTMIELAAKRLKDGGVFISPNVLDVAERLCVVEHIDHGRFRAENRIALYQEIFSLYGLNELDTYRYSVSVAGAGGMVQMIPATYQMERLHHPGVGLNPDFVPAMRNHGNALEAMLLYMQDTWNDLASNPDVTYALGAKIATTADLMAAGYNSNPARLPLYIRRGGPDWRLLIPRETQTYLQIYHSLDALVPTKPHS
jgi:hypothetical protein